MITHIVALTWKPGTTDDQVTAITDALATMPTVVPTIATYRFGTDIALSGPNNADFGIVATFATAEDWHAYDEHPEHERIRAEIIRPCIAERTTLQFES